MTRRTLLITALALFTLPGLLLAQADKQAVEQAERGWAKAVVAADFPALEKIFADDLIYTHSSGVTETKAEYIGKLRSGTKYEAIDYESITVKPHGNVAIVHAKAHFKVTTPTGGTDANLVMLHVWVKNGGTWQLAAHQSTRLP